MACLESVNNRFAELAALGGEKCVQVRPIVVDAFPAGRMGNAVGAPGTGKQGQERVYTGDIEIHLGECDSRASEDRQHGL